MNSKGGILFIGVKDNGSFVGLDKDYSILNKENKRDQFRQLLTKVVIDYIGLPYHQLLDIRFAHFYSREVCLIKVNRSPVLVPLSDISGKISYVTRTDKSVHTLKGKDLEQYKTIRENQIMK